MSWSIRARLALWCAALVLVVLGTATTVIATVQARASLMRLDSELHRLELTVEAVIMNEFGEGLDLPGAAREASAEVIARGHSVVIARPDGSVVQAWGAPLPKTWRSDVGSLERAGETVRLSGSEYRIVGRHVASEDRPFVVAVLTAMAPLEAEQRELFRTLTIGTTVALLVTAIGGWLVAQQALRPLSAMAGQAALVGEHTLTARLVAPNARDELGRLAASFNGLLDRLAAALTSQRQFMADASHQLRTPVSVLRTTADVTLGQPHRDEHDYREALAIVTEQAVRLAKLVDAMFLLSRAEAGGRPIRREPVYLDEIIGDCVRALKMIAAERRVRIATTGPSDVAFTGDEELLRHLFTNLLDNAIGLTPSDRQISIETSCGQDVLIVRVTDEGPGIPECDRDRIFERFTRLDRSRNGAGLGLPIARWIAEAHGGRVDLAASSSQGSVFMVTLPRNDTSIA